MTTSTLNPTGSRWRVGARSIAALHTAVILMVAATVVAAGLVVFPETRPSLVEHFGVIRVLVYATWALGFAAFLGAPLLLVRELGERFSWSLPSIRAALFSVGGAPLESAVLLGLVGNGLVLLLSPLGVVLQDRYTWPVFLGHTLGSVIILAVTVTISLMRVRAIVAELQPAGTTKRVSVSEPAGF